MANYIWANPKGSTPIAEIEVAGKTYRGYKSPRLKLASSTKANPSITFYTAKGNTFTTAEYMTTIYFQAIGSSFDLKPATGSGSEYKRYPVTMSPSNSGTAFDFDYVSMDDSDIKIALDTLELFTVYKNNSIYLEVPGISSGGGRRFGSRCIVAESTGIFEDIFDTPSIEELNPDNIKVNEGYVLTNNIYGVSGLPQSVLSKNFFVQLFANHLYLGSENSYVMSPASGTPNNAGYRETWEVYDNPFIEFYGGLRIDDWTNNGNKAGMPIYFTPFDVAVLSAAGTDELYSSVGDPIKNNCPVWSIVRIWLGVERIAASV